MVAIPVKTRTTGDGGVKWKLPLRSGKITTRLCAVQIEGQVAGLFPAAVPCVRVEIRLGAHTISVPAAAWYGFDEETRDVQMNVDETANSGQGGI
ncbi:MAG: hypothetical protein ACLQVD_22515 [Capsulimonadaceae bacterium]